MSSAVRVHGGTPLHGELRVSGSKNAALPIMVASLLSTEPSRITNLPGLADVALTESILRELGAAVEAGDPGELTITAAGDIAAEVPTERARAMRGSILFLGPLLARTGRAVVPKPGGDDIGMRRVDQHIYGMVELGATVTEENGRLVCTADRLRGADILLDMPTVTGTENIMMAATLAEGVTSISNAAREPHVADLARALMSMGARITGAGTDQIVVEGVAALGGMKHRVVPDYLEAGTYAMAAAATGGDVLLVDCPVNDIRSLVLKLRSAGVDMEVGIDSLRVRRQGPFRATDLITWTHPGFATDLQPQFSALMTQATGESVVQEFLFDNRFQYVAELEALGANIEVFPHRRGIVVKGPSELRANVVTIPDIRAGAALVIAALCARGETMLTQAEHLDRGYEDMAGKLSKLGAAVRSAAA